MIPKHPPSEPIMLGNIRDNLDGYFTLFADSSHAGHRATVRLDSGEPWLALVCYGVLLLAMVWQAMP